VNTWDKRYGRGELLDREPHPVITTFADQRHPGRALDLACGPGRHAIWLAEHGWDVTAVDYSSVAIEILEQRARDKNLRLNARVANLEKHEFVIERAAYDLIVDCNYLQRDLFPLIREGTRIGGMVICVIGMIDEDPRLKPMNPAYLLQPGELRRQFERWEVIHDFEGKQLGDSPRRATAEIVAFCRRGL